VARTRAQRRRQTSILTIGLAVTLVVLLFARDVNRSAHESTSPRQSENQTFGALANALITQENSFAHNLNDLIDAAPRLNRIVFQARLVQLDQQLPTWTTEAELLSKPTLVHRVNETLSRLTLQHVDDYTKLFSVVASRLDLPWTPPQKQFVRTPEVLENLNANPVTDLQNTQSQWNTVNRFALDREPGRVRLEALWSSFASNGVLSLSQNINLRVQRGVGIGAVEVLPTPLPAASGEILVVPTNRLQINTSVENPNFVRQPVTFTVSLRPTNHRGVAFSQTLKAVIGPNGAYAFTPKGMTVATGEKADLAITVSGAPSAVGLSRSRTYVVVVSPSGQG